MVVCADQPHFLATSAEPRSNEPHGLPKEIILRDLESCRYVAGLWGEMIGLIL